MTLPEARITHATPGRTRLRVASRRRDESYFAQVGAQLGQAPGVARVQTNELTASIVVEHRADMGELAAYCERAGLFRLCLGTPAVVPLAGQVYERARDANRGFGALTGGRFDIAALGFVALIGASYYQARRGQLLGPATTLFFQALTALSLAQKRSET